MQDKCGVVWCKYLIIYDTFQKKEVYYFNLSNYTSVNQLINFKK